MNRFPENPALRPAFRALAGTIVPQAAVLPEQEWDEVERIIAHALRDRPASLRRQLGSFIRILDLLPRARWGRSFRALDPARRSRFLEAVERSPLFLVRRGFWGLRTLVYMGYYGRETTHAAIGYRAAKRGWLEHPDTSPAAIRALEREGTTGG